MNTSSDPSLRSESVLQPVSCEIDDGNLAKRRNSGEVNNEKDCSNDGAKSTTAECADSRFSCNICFDEVTEPVVTRCGHLYSWPCLFQWLEPGMTREERESLGLSSFRYGGRNPNRRVCPVCKAVCPLLGIVPLYIQSPTTPSSRLKSCATSPAKNMVESNKMDPHEPENDARSNSPESRIEATDEGLRRRRANNNIPNDLNNDSEPVAVPNRPSVAHPQHHQREPTSPTMSRRSSPGSSPRTRASTDNPYRAGAVQLTPRSPNGHNGSLTYGILSSLQRATAEYYRINQTNNGDEPDRRIPSLHNRRDPVSNHNTNGSSRFVDYPQGYAQYDDGNGTLNSETTQYLTRLLIMLTSFVIFCFLAV